MANRYGEAALMAVRMETYGKAITPLERWQDAVGKLYPTAESARRKAGPREAFVALCDAGLVQGIRAATGPASVKGGEALHAVELLRTGTHSSISQLWAAVGSPGKQHASQMDVVLALWKNGLIVAG